MLINRCMLFTSFLSANVTYFEWGTGRSTELAHKYCRKTHSIEHDYHFAQLMARRLPTASIQYVDIGHDRHHDGLSNNTSSYAYINSITNHEQKRHRFSCWCLELLVLFLPTTI